MKEIKIHLIESPTFSVQFGRIINIPDNIDLENKVIVVYYDFFDKEWLSCKNFYSTNSLYNYDEVEFYDETVSFFRHSKNKFKYAVAYKFIENKFVRFLIQSFNYEKGYLFNNADLKEIKEYRWVKPSQITISINDIVHLSFDGFGTFDAIKQENKGYSFCKKIFDHKIENIQVFFSETEMSKMSVKEIKQYITCPICAKNYINFIKF